MSRPTPANETDVVFRLSDHQSNLEAGRGCRHDIAVVVLPLPPLCRYVPAPWNSYLTGMRVAQLASWAAELGGGDGPVPVWDLEDDRRPLEALLRELHRTGTRRLMVHGGRDQPGFARALMSRFGGPVLLADHARDSVLTPLMESITSLECEGIRIEGREQAPAAGDGSAWCYAVDRERRLAPWTGFLPFAAVRGDAVLLREGWLQYWRHAGAADAVRAAALGIDAALEDWLRPEKESDGHGGLPPSPPIGPAVFAITGLDGSGKSTHAAQLVEALNERGFRSAAFKVYRRGPFLDFANELGARTRSGAPLAAFRLSRLVKLVDSLRAYRDEIFAAGCSYDVLVFDRHIETHVAAARSQLGWDLAHHPALALFPVPLQTFLLDLTPEQALDRIRVRADPPSADEHLLGLAGYAGEFARLAAADPSGYAVLPADAQLTENAGRVLAHAIESLSRRKKPRKGNPFTSPQSANVDAAIPHTFFGEDILTLCRFCRERLGKRQHGFPEAFWIEAYAAWLVLELRADTGEAPARVIPLWPYALRRVGMFADLYALAELERMTLPEMDKTRVSSVPGVAHAALEVLAPGCARHVLPAYLERLRETARDHGWRLTEAVPEPGPIASSAETQDHEHTDLDDQPCRITSPAARRP